MVYAVMPVISVLFGKPLTFSLLSDRTVLLYTLSIYIAGSVASGLYPALVLSSFKPVSIFRTSRAITLKGNTGLREALVIFQFMISAGLITGTIIIGNQMEFIRNKSLGYVSDNTIVLSASSTQENDSIARLRYYTFRETLLKYPTFSNVSISSVVPGKSYNDLDTHGGIRMVGDSKDVSYSLASFRADENFIDVYDMKLIAGENFSDRYRQGEQDVILNRNAAVLLGFNDPKEIIGKKMDYQGRPREVVGVIENYHHKSLRNSFEPMVIRHVVAGSMLYVTIKLEASNSMESSIDKLREQWTAIYPSDPFVYFFLDDHVKAQYDDDVQFRMIFNIFSAFSMFIACLGLFGLVSYSVSIKIKEIGVRKVLGASVGSILLLFSKGYLRLLVISFIIGIPLANYVLGLWVDNFAYSAGIRWTTFVIPVVTVTFLSMIAISFEVIRAALMNPVNSLRNE
jgi:putative ABC transport system permease protein